MDLLNKTKELCRAYNIKPSRSKGQNFLINEAVYDKIVEAADLKEDDVVLEVGPGLGFLTAKLAARAKRVVAVELDDKLAEVLKTGLTARGIKNVEVINKNILELRIMNHESWDKKSESKIHDSVFSIQYSYKIVANLPYNITSVFLRKFLSVEHKPSLMVLMLQKEVAERIVARPGEMSLLAVSVQFYAKPEIIEYVPARDFYPAPEVDSAIIRLRIMNYESKIMNKVDEREYFRLVKIGFSARRKMLKNNLANGYHIGQKEAENWIKRTGFNEKVRAQELSVDDWLKLLEAK